MQDVTSPVSLPSFYCTTTLFSSLSPFIPLACAKCDDSLPFSGTSSVPLCYIHFSSTLSHQLLFHPPSVHIVIYFLFYLSASFFPNSYLILLEFFFLRFSAHAQNNVIHLTLLSLFKWVFLPWHKFLYRLIFSNFLFSFPYTGPKILLYTFLSKMSICFLSIFVSIQVSYAYVKVLSIIVFLSLNFSRPVSGA
jgi:hypothetical protein